mmetsp:Transcript_75346/g.179037  ORF Transcript_75346/g.179037 Transcript_75346/m.179037 type:complete len:83 (-) Transcript_75346:854-1102(-)
MSRWLVGSSSTMMCGLASISAAKATRAFCPPDRLPIFVKWDAPGSANCPSTARAFSGGDKLKSSCRYAVGSLSKGSNSSKCW